MGGKRKGVVFIFTSLIIGIAGLLSIYFVLIATGVIQTREKTLIITSKSSEKVYDGTELVCNEYIAENIEDLKENHRIEVVYSGHQTTVGESENLFTVFVYDEENVDVTSNYIIKTNVGTLKVLPRSIEITGKNKEKEYDGEELSWFDDEELSWDWTNTNNLVGDDWIEVVNLTSKTDVGEIYNKLSTHIYNIDGEDVTSNYDIQAYLGTLKINPRTFTVTSKTAEKEYDNEVLTCHEIIENDEKFRLVEGHEIKTLFTGEAIYPSDEPIENKFTVEIYDANGTNVTSNYAPNYQYGLLIIDKRQITLKVEGANKKYDGEPLSNDEYHIIDRENRLIDGHYEIVELYTMVTDVGEETNIANIEIYDKEGNVVTSYYDVIHAEGTIRVDKGVLNLVADDYIGVYDGQTHIQNTFRMENGSLLPDGFVIEPIFNNEITDVGIVANTFEVRVLRVKDGNITDKTNMFDITCTPGILQVNKRPITIDVPSITKYYDGKPVTNYLPTQEPSNLVNGQRITYTSNISEELVNAKLVENTVLVRIDDVYGNDVTDNYDITNNPGVIEIKRQPLTIQGETPSAFVYDGQAHTYTEWFVASGTIVSGESVELSFRNSISFVGTIENTFDVLDITNYRGASVVDNYEISCIPGTLTMVKRDITINTSSSSKVYDGNTLKSNDASVSAYTPLATSDSISYESFALKDKNVGLISNTCNVVITNRSRTDVTNQYNISYNYGTLEIFKNEITVTSPSKTKVYDGEALTTTRNSDFEIIGTLAASDKYSFEPTGSQTNVGESPNYFDAKIVTYLGEDVTSNYIINKVEGKLTVTKAELLATSETLTKEYDGTALKGTNINFSYDVKTGKLPSGSKVTYEITGSRTNAGGDGVKENTFIVKITDRNNNIITNNYNITYSFGDLIVTPRSITFRSSDGEKTYDGLALEVKTAEIVDSSDRYFLLGLNHSVQYTFKGSTTHVSDRPVDNEFTVVIKDKSNNDVSKNYNINYIYGKLTITPRRIEVQSDNGEKTYDGTDLTKKSAKIISTTKLALGDEITYNFPDRSIQNVGTYNNDFTVTISRKGVDVTKNYSITITPGTLEIKPIKLTITSPDAQKVYDGYPLTNPSEPTIKGTLARNNTMDYIATGSITDVGIRPNTFTVSIKNRIGVDVTSNYSIECVYGNLQVVERQLIITSESAEKVYDGTPLANLEFTLTGTLADNHYLDYMANSSITDVGRIDNKFRCDIFDEYGNSVLKNYQIESEYGQLEVKARQITVTSLSAEKYYDKTPLMCLDYNLTGTLAANQYLIYTPISSITNAGEQANMFAVEIEDEFGNTVTGNYNIVANYGTLHVKQISISLESKGNSKFYDGLPIEIDDELIIRGGSLVPGQYLMPVFSGYNAFVEAGTYENAYTVAGIFDAGEDVTSNYDILQYDCGKLIINRREITITTGSAEKPYDGEELISHEYSIVGSLVSNHEIVIDYIGSQTEIGKSTNNCIITIQDTTTFNDVTHNYEVNLKLGELVVTETSPGAGGDFPVLNVYSTTSGIVYLRGMSYGAYTGSNSDWDEAPVYTGDYSKINPLYLTNSAFINSSYGKFLAEYPNETIKISYVEGYNPGYYLIPYYASNTPSLNNDIYQSSLLDTYSFNYINYNFDQNYDFFMNQKYGAVESIYRAYVYGADSTYLQIPSQTKTAMLAIAAANGLSADDDNIIFKVKNYISNAAVYDDKHVFAASVIDEAVQFLTVDKRGVCRDFASAAVMMFRALGIPARYTTGFYVKTKANSNVEVNSKSAHAWCEVYVDGLGWAHLEVTASGGYGLGGPGGNNDGEDGNGPGGNNDGDGDGNGPGGTKKPKYVVKPKIQLYKYDGEMCSLNDDVIFYDGEDYKKKKDNFVYINKNDDFASYNVVAKIGLKNTSAAFDAGTYTTYIRSIKIYNSANEDITDNFEWYEEDSYLKIYYEEIKIKTESLTKEYDGTPLVSTSYDNGASVKNVYPGHRIVTIKVNNSITDAGKISNEPYIKIIDENGNNVTDKYYINRSLYGTLEVSKKEINIKVNDKTVVYNGEPVFADPNGYTLMNDLLPGHYLNVNNISGSLSNFGQSILTINETDIKIRDSEGNDVTSNYQLNIIPGMLTATK